MEWFTDNSYCKTFSWNKHWKMGLVSIFSYKNQSGRYLLNNRQHTTNWCCNSSCNIWNFCQTLNHYPRKMALGHLLKRKVSQTGSTVDLPIFSGRHHARFIYTNTCTGQRWGKGKCLRMKIYKSGVVYQNYTISFHKLQVHSILCVSQAQERKKPTQKEIFAAIKKTAGPCSTTLVAVLQSLHISHQGHHSGSFVGNQIDKMLKVGLHT